MPKTNNSKKSEKLIPLICSNCGGKLDLYLDNMQAFCPYCGEKLLVDINQLGHILSEREKTKRRQMDIEAEERMELLKSENKNKDAKRIFKYTIGLAIAMILAMIVMINISHFTFSSFEKDYSSAYDKHEERMESQKTHLETLLQEIKKDMDNGDYDSALFKANQLHYTDTGFSSEEDALTEKWDNIRESTIKMIEEAKAKDSGS